MKFEKAIDYFVQLLLACSCVISPILNIEQLTGIDPLPIFKTGLYFFGQTCLFLFSLQMKGVSAIASKRYSQRLKPRSDMSEAWMEYGWLSG